MHISLAAIDSKAANLTFRIDGNNKSYEQAMSLDMKVEAKAIFLNNLQLMKDLKSLTPQINEQMKGLRLSVWVSDRQFLKITEVVVKS